MERQLKNVSKNYKLVAGAEEHIHEEIVKVTLPKECTKCTRKVWTHDDRSFIDEKGFFCKRHAESSWNESFYNP